MKSKLQVKTLTFILFAIILNLSISCQENEKIVEYELIKIISYNIYHCANDEVVIDITNAARVIKKANPDIVVLQGVDRNTTRVQGKDLATELGYLTYMNPVFGRAIDYGEGEYGVAILSKYNIIKSQLYKFPFIENTEPRVALEVLIQLKSNDTVRVVGTHLSSKSENLRLDQAKYLDNLFQDNISTILAGNLNAVPTSNTINYLKTYTLWKYLMPHLFLITPKNLYSTNLFRVFYKCALAWSSGHTHAI